MLSILDKMISILKIICMKIVFSKMIDFAQ